MFIEPMYACPVPNLTKNPRAKPVDLESGLWVAEEKYDGIRLVTEVCATKDRLFVDKGVTSWSRYGNLRPLPDHIMEQVAKLPDCIIDGELMAPGKRSYGTMDLDNQSDLIYYVFDIIQFETTDCTAFTYQARRSLLHDVMVAEASKPQSYLALTPAMSVLSWEDVYRLRDEVYARDGEGLILKRVTTPYTSGKRPKQTWIKIKQLQCSPFTVVGFTPSRGLINDRGPYGMVQLVDDEGHETAVKTRNDAECRRFEELGRNLKAGERHPDLGRTLWCEWQERTPDGQYRHIRWNHWEGE